MRDVELRGVAVTRGETATVQLGGSALRNDFFPEFIMRVSNLVYVVKCPTSASGGGVIHTRTRVLTGIRYSIPSDVTPVANCS